MLAAGRSDGSIELWQPCTGASLGSIVAPKAFSAEQKEGRTLRGLAICWSSSRQAAFIGFSLRPGLATPKREEVLALGTFPCFTWSVANRLDVQLPAFGTGGKAEVAQQQAPNGSRGVMLGVFICHALPYAGSQPSFHVAEEGL